MYWVAPLDRSTYCVPHGLKGFKKGDGRQNGENQIDVRDTEGVESIGFGSLLGDNNK